MVEAYRGADRRNRLADAPRGVPTAGVVKQALVLVVGALLPTAFVLLRGASPFAAADLLHALTGILAVTAGVASLVLWRVLGVAFASWFGVALLDLGLLTLANGSLPALGIDQMSAAEPLARLAICALVAGLMIPAFRSPQVDATLTPWTVLGVTSLGGLCILGVLDLLFTHGLLASITSPADQAWTGAATTAIWMALGMLALYEGRRRSLHPWVVWVLLGLALGEATGIAPAARASRWEVMPAAATLLALAVALTGTMWQLRSTLQSQDRHSRHLRLDLDDLARQMDVERAHLEEQLHDLRNAVAAMRSADSVLRRYARQLDAPTRDALADALSSELVRLQALIEPNRRPKVVGFWLAEALAAVVTTERSGGTDIDLQVGNLRARGDAQALAQVVQNLLVNARRYAPGSPVRVLARAGPGRVELLVEDTGPGIPEAEALAIFGRGSRGTSSVGTQGDGLGLFVAAQLMTDMGGSLRLGRKRESGTRFVLELPADVTHRRRVASGRTPTSRHLRPVS